MSLISFEKKNIYCLNLNKEGLFCFQTENNKLCTNCSNILKLIENDDNIKNLHNSDYKNYKLEKKIILNIDTRKIIDNSNNKNDNKELDTQKIIDNNDNKTDNKELDTQKIIDNSDNKNNNKELELKQRIDKYYNSNYGKNSIITYLLASSGFLIKSNKYDDNYKHSSEKSQISFSLPSEEESKFFEKCVLDSKNFSNKINSIK